MKKYLLAVSAAAVLGLAFIISGCNSARHESPRDAVELTEASVGDIVVFGDIRWYVIAKTNTGYTLLSEKPVIKQAFRKSGTGIFNVTWEESTLRAWLNDKFYDTFTDEEKALAVSDDTRDCGIDWWLRTPGKYQYDAQYIGLRSPDTIGNYVDSHMAVRPAIRVRYLGQTVDR